MLISWNWLKEYVRLDMSAEELVRRLMMAGLNHESTTDVEGDLAIDLEVTSNRPDCLGHIGIAREVAVLFDLRLTYSDANVPTHGKPDEIRRQTSVEVVCQELCPRYSARLIRGVKIAPSPPQIAAR